MRCEKCGKREDITNPIVQIKVSELQSKPIEGTKLEQEGAWFPTDKIQDFSYPLCKSCFSLFEAWRKTAP